MRTTDIAAPLALLALAACTAPPDGSHEPRAAASPGLPDLYEPGVLSTADYELNAAFSPSGDTLLFTRSAFSHWWMTVFVTTREAGGWSEPQVASFSGRYSDADAIYTPDGSTVYFISDRPITPEGSTGDFNIWRVAVTANGFGEPEALPAPIRTDRQEYFPAVARSGTLYFSAVRDGGIGSFDLLRAEPRGDGWAEPEILPETVNGPGAEIDVVVDPDERFIVCAAYGRDEGLGSGDLYVSFRTPDGWTAARNLGAPVNSPAREYAPGLSPDGAYLFVTSERTRYRKGDTTLTARTWDRLMHEPGNGQGDLYRYRLSDLAVFRAPGPN